MKKIPLTKNRSAIVDDEDYKFLNRFKWRAVSNKVNSFNVTTSLSLQGNKVFSLPMWCFLMEQKNRMKIIFLNSNPLDHRKSNLYLGTPSEHCIAQPKNIWPNRKITSKYKGVCFEKSQGKNGKYRATIQKQGKEYSKRFLTEIEAATWYNEMAYNLYGNIAYQNKLN